MSRTRNRGAWQWLAMIVIIALLAGCGAPAAQPAEPAAAQPAQESAQSTTQEAAPSASKEAPMLAEMVTAGSLPPVEERLPVNPLVLEPVESAGQYGGTLRMIAGDDNLGWLRMTVGNEGLVKWERDVSGTRPNILESWEWNADATELTAKLRQGIKWSDGEPFTANDYLFWWNEMVLDESIGLSTPAGTRVNGEPMKVDMIDDFTLKFTFAASHPLFVDLAARGFYNSSQHLVPSHYLKQFHPKHNSANADAKELLARYNNPLQFPDMPVLFAWRTVEYVSGDHITMERNPYFWKTDADGNQLPYIDRIEAKIVPAGGNAAELITLKGIAGELDFQVRDIPLKDVPVLKENEAKGNYTVKLWKRGDYAWPWLILYYDYPDEGIVDLMYNQQFRTALSVAINRERISEVVSLGLGQPRQAALSPESPEFRSDAGKEVYDQWVNLAAAFDPDQANALLDEVGLKDVDGDGLRERADGTPLELIVSVSQDDRQSVDAMELIKQDWEAVGLKTVVAPDEWSTFSQRVMAGEVMIRAWGSAAAWGLISAATVWAPVEGVTYCMGGARIGLYYQTGGKEGIPARPGSMLERLQQRYTEVLSTVDPAEREAKLLEAYKVHIEDGPLYIGTIGDHPSALIVSNNLRNVPDFGLVAGWDLGFPGTADPEQFYFAQ
ncbi:MAG: ABC transporter substrate-binding protein [Caldilinea sp. CFX5]|nr:ABC transporter substrate-binding protein [Caldilinea sp. CFX5]